MLKIISGVLLIGSFGFLCSMESSADAENLTRKSGQKRDLENPLQSAAQGKKKKRKKDIEHKEDTVQTIGEDLDKVPYLPEEMIEHIVSFVPKIESGIASIKNLKNLELVNRAVRSYAKKRQNVDWAIHNIINGSWQYADMEEVSRALGKAVYTGDYESMRSFLRTRVNSAHANAGDHRSPLLRAGKHNRKPILKKLLSSGALVCDNEFATQLLSAVVRGKMARIQALLKRPFGKFENAKDINGVNALMYAANNGNNDLIELFLPLIPIMETDDFGNNALMYAVSNGHKETVKLLLKHGAAIDAENENGTPVLMFAVVYNQPEVLQQLINQGANYTREFSEPTVGPVWTPLHSAAYSGLTRVAQVLLDNHANIEAIYNDEKEAVIDNNSAITPLVLAVHKNNKAMVELLIKNGAQINAVTGNGGTALTYACYVGNLEIVKMLLDHGADVSVGEFFDGASNLMVAVGEGQDLVVELLITHGADINAVCDYDGETALITAVGDRYDQIVDLLLKNNAHVNIQDKIGKTALMRAIIEESLVCTQLLVTAGADLNLQDTDGNTALMHACQAGNKELALLLIKHGADVTIVNSKGKSAIDIAQEQNMSDVFTDQFLNAEYSLIKN